MNSNKETAANKYSFELMSGSPISIDETCSVYPLSLREIGSIGYDRYQAIIGLLTMSKDVLSGAKDADLSGIDIYDIIAATSIEDNSFRESIEEGLALFLKEPVKFFADGSVFVIGTLDDIKDESKELRFVGKDVYSKISQIIRLQNLMKLEEEKEEKVYASEKARLLAKKRDRGRKMMADIRGGDETTVEGLISMAGVFTGDINKVMDWTIYQLHDQCEIYIKKEQYEAKFQQLLAGADPKKLKLDKHWSEG